MVQRKGLNYITFILILVPTILMAGYLTAYGSDPNGPDIVRTRCYTDSTKVTEIPYGTWTNDKTLYFEWTDPKSPSGDTFYYELNHSPGNTIGFNEAHTTTVNHVEITLDSESDNWWFHVAAKNGAGAEGPQGKPRKILIKYDSTKPTVDITTPSDAGVIEGTATINADITEDHPDAISVKIDGSKVAASLPYSWDTTAVSDGSHTITVEETDKAGNTGSDSITAVVDNRPTAEFSAAPTSGDEPLTVNFTDQSTSPHGIASWSWDFGDGGASSAQNPTHTYLQQGTYTVKLTVTEADDDGDTDTSTKTDYITVTDTGPTASLSGDTSIDEGVAGSYDASGSTGYDTPLSYEWDWNYSGTFTPSGDTGATQSHAWSDNGTYTVAVRVTDSDGSTDIATLVVTVNNVDPTITAVTNDGPVGEASPVTVTVTASDVAGANDPLSYEFDFDNDGTYEVGPQASNQASHTYMDDGSYPVNVRVTDGDGGSATGTTTVTVNNVAPSVTCPGDQTVNEGTPLTGLQVTFTDPGADTHTATLNWGDGTTDGLGSVISPFSLGSYVYANNGIYTVTVTVTDDDGGVGSDTFTVTVDNVAPTVNAGADQTVNDGDLVSLDPATFNDKGTLDTHTATIDWGDGTALDVGTVTEAPFGPPGSTAGLSGTVAGSHTYVGFVGPFHVYTVTVTVTDDDTGVGADTFNVRVNDVGKPSTTLTVTPPNPDNNSSPYFEWTGTDDYSPSANLVYSYRVDKGSWSVWSVPGVNYVTLTGLSEGTHTFEVRAMDEAGNIGNIASYTWVLDLTGPEVTITVPEDGAAYALNDAVNSDWIAVDALSGLDTASASDDVNTGMASGEPFYTGSVGLHEFTVTTTDYAGNTTTETVTYRVVYTVNPGGAAGGGGGAGKGKGTPGFLDKSIAGGGGAVGITALEALYTVGDIIHASFSLTDADGNNIPDAVVSCTLVKVTLGEEEAYEVLNLWRFVYSADTELYYLDIPTEKLAPGICDLWLGFDDGTQKRLRIQLEGG